MFEILSKFGTVVHLGIKIKEKNRRKNLGANGPFFWQRKMENRYFVYFDYIFFDNL